MLRESDLPEWDFFVSYQQTDRTWAEWSAWQLETAGHSVLLQLWDFVPGTNWVKLMQDGASRSARHRRPVPRLHRLRVRGRRVVGDLGSRPRRRATARHPDTSRRLRATRACSRESSASTWSAFPSPRHSSASKMPSSGWRPYVTGRLARPRRIAIYWR
jgi:TIR domain